MQKHLLMGKTTKKSKVKVVETPQDEPIPGSKQKKNNAGGYAFEVSNWEKLDRFLILGSQGGTFYVSENKLTADNCDAVIACIKKDGIKTVDRIVEISDGGRAPKNDYALFAFALCTKHGDDRTRAWAFHNLDKVARIGTHLFHFAEFRQLFGGWGRGMRDAVARWYTSKDIDQLAYQLVKYRQRDGWTHRDMLRLSHPKGVGKQYHNLFKWVVDKEYDRKTLPRVVEGYLKIQETTSGKTAAKLIRDYGLTREAVPTTLLTSAEVWDALLEKMPMTAMIRNLANMTRIGVLSPLNDNVKLVCSALADKEQLHKSRIHPIAVISALMAYRVGRSSRDSDKVWSPIAQINDSLEDAFYASFKNVIPSNKRIMLALDVSGSMSWTELAGVPGLTPRDASAVLSLVTASVEPNYMIKGFCSTLRDLVITKRSRLGDAIKYLSGLPAGGTDCAAPITWANQNKQKIDAFVVYTDNETWAGGIHPSQALTKYKQDMGIDAKLVVVGMQANEFSIADPKNPKMLDVVGFDTNTPAAISDFIAG